jgi:tetratricopeptide (TPR) repeat protein
LAVWGKNKLKPGLFAEPVLVDRECELEQLHSILNLAIEGKGNTVFVSGEAGVGKTRLVNEFLNSAKKQAVTFLTGWCISNSAVPYFPFFEAFRRYFSTEPGTKDVDIKNLFMGPPQSEKLGNPQIITPQIWKDQTFTAVASTLILISKKHPVILFLDDLHWADSASCALLHYLANIIDSEKILIIATFRVEQLADGNNGRPHPLLETLRLMRRQDLIKEITVLNLDEIGVSKLARNMLGSNLQQEFTRKLTEESQGNPLFIVESIRMLNESKCLIQEHDKWRLTSTTIGIPPKIKDIILQRLGSLLNTQRNVLEAASVIGENFDSALLSAVLERDSIEIIKILDAIARDTSLVHCAGEFYSFDHARTRETIYGEISSALRRSYHAKIAQKLESISKNDKFSFSDIAYHYTQAGNKSKAVQYALAAGQNALSKWSNVESIKHFFFVVQTVGTNPEYFHDRLIAIEGLGDAYYANDNFAKAIETYEQLADIQNGTTKLRAFRKAIRAASYLGDISKQRTLIQKAEAIATTDRLETGRILYEKGTVVGGENDWVSALKLIEEALQVFEEEYALSDAASVLPLMGYVAATLGHLETGVVATLRSIALHNELGDIRSQIEAYAYAGGSFQACALEEISNQMLAKAVELNEQNKIWDYVRVIPAYVWWSVGLIGVDLEKSVSKVLRALEYSEKTDSRLYTGAIYGVLIMAHALAEDQVNVDKYFAKLTSLPKHIFSNGPSQVYLGPAMGAYYSTKKEFEKSNQCFSQSLAVANSLFPNPFFEASTRQLFAWALGKQGRVEEAKHQMEKAQKIIETTRKEFSRVNIQSSLTSFAKPEVNQVFPIRLDFVNVSKNQGSIIKVENFLFPGLRIIDVSPNCIIEDDHLEFKDKKIEAFEFKTMKITVQATKPGEFRLTPTFIYIDQLGETKSGRILKIVPKLIFENNSKTVMSNTLESVKIVVHPSSSPEPQIEKTEDGKLKFEFETKSAKEAFDFLLSSFVQDYMNRRFPLELSGWRTLMDIVKNARISKRAVYGASGLNGRVVSELERRGLVEIRVFPGERGRGGLIQKVRVSYEKETIARLVDERVMKSGKKH